METDPDVQYTTVDGIRMAYRESGTGSKPPMVLLHGLGLTSAVCWRPFVDQFAGQYRIVAFDMLGHGSTDAPTHGYTAARQARLIAGGMDNLGIRMGIVIGHSMGGIVAARLAIDLPERVHRLILYGSPLPDGTFGHLRSLMQHAPKRAIIPLALLLTPGAGQIAELLPRRPLAHFLMSQLRVVYHGRSLTEDLIGQAARNSGVALAEDIRHVVLRARIIQDLARITMPTLVLVGDHDLLLSTSDARQIASSISGSKFAVIRHAGHYALLDNPDEFNSQVRAYLHDDVAS